MRRCSICLKIGEKKAFYRHDSGYPTKDFFKALDPAMENIVEEKLDEAGIDYDWGPLDRLIVENDEDCDEVEDILDECDIAYFAV